MKNPDVHMSPASSGELPDTQSTAHTPGPWILETHGCERRADYWHITGANGQFICHFHQMVAQAMPSTLANARLIAAAPELLEALTEMTERYAELVNCGDCGNWDPEEETEVIAARAALAKARGGRAKDERNLR